MVQCIYQIRGQGLPTKATNIGPPRTVMIPQYSTKRILDRSGDEGCDKHVGKIPEIIFTFTHDDLISRFISDQFDRGALFSCTNSCFY